MNVHGFPIGRNVRQPGGYAAFVPATFPSQELLSYSPAIIQKNAEAARLLGKLDGITQLLPDVDFFMSMYVRKDAAASSQIEGTRATMVDAAEAAVHTSNALPSDVDDILHYIKALKYGMKRLEEFPFSLRFIRELHRELMHGARSSHAADPGNFRRSQNWIGGRNPSEADFVPPAVHDMHAALHDFEKFLHTASPVPPLIQAALLHAQFETIHPFLDGNGRTGRMLVTLYLWKEKLLEKPVLYLSAYLKKYRRVYYERLTDYREGRQEQWIGFFLDGIIETAESATESVRRITLLRERDMAAIATLNKTSASSAMRVLPKLFAQPVVTVDVIRRWAGFRTRAGAQRLIDHLCAIGILETPDASKKYARTYVYRTYVDIFEKSITAS